MRVACVFLRSEYSVQKLAEVCLRLSPQLCVKNERALFIEIGKCRRLYTEEGFTNRLKVILRRLQIDASISIQDSIGSAYVCARYQVTQLQGLPLEVLPELVDPFGADPVLQKYIEKMLKAFKDLGVKTLGGFQRLPSRELVPRFGVAAAICQERLQLKDPTPWPLWKPEEIISEKTEFPYFEFYGELEPLLFELKKHLDSIFSRLWGRTRRLQSLTVKIVCETHSRQPVAARILPIEFFTPQTSTKACLAILQEKLFREFQVRPLVSPLQSLETTVAAHVPGGMGQKSLLHNREEEEEKLSGLIGFLMESHGKDNIYQAELTEDRRPEKSWKKKPHFKKSESKNLKRHIPLRPSCLIKPEVIQVTKEVLSIRNQKFKVIEWGQGIEHISGDWVDDKPFDRTYLTAVLEDGRKVSIFHTPDKKYFLHGYFG